MGPLTRSKWALVLAADRRCACSFPDGTRNAYASQRRLLSGRNLVQELSSRQFVASLPHGLTKHLEQPRTVCLGVDPTANSPHPGHLLPSMRLPHLQPRGNCVNALVSGQTPVGLVGNSSRRMAERQLAEETRLELNAPKLAQAVRKFFSSAATYAKGRLSARPSALPPLQASNFLWTTGIRFRANSMLTRDSAKARMSTQQGVSFAEFTYQLLQGYGFHELSRTHGRNIQVGGSDQWGNILSGVELINKMERTAIFFMRTSDSDAEKHLKQFTLLPVEEIPSVVHDHRAPPEHRIAQKLLAEEATLMVHGPKAVLSSEDGLDAAKIAAQVHFGTNYTTLKAEQAIKSLTGGPLCTEEGRFAASLPNPVTNHKLAPSKSATHQLAQAGGLCPNNKAQRDPRFLVTRGVLIDGEAAAVRAGKDSRWTLALRTTSNLLFYCGCRC
ncbi:hypothetical protein EV363DRAFT_1540601 [Boletus edulis]|nr:hypothetical protein EV363DRAFT_1540601 [Boletus edulis]